VLVVVSIVVALLVGATALLGVALASVHRRHHPRIALPPAMGVQGDLEGLAGITQGELTDGNRVTLVEDGSYLRELVELAATATQTLHFETFLWKTGAMSAAFGEALVQAVRRGVTVRVLVDAIGSREMEDEEQRALEARGVKVLRLRKPSFQTLGWLNNRTHRKILVIDGRVAVLGGHCIDDRWIGGDGQDPEVRDVSVRVEGPVVRPIQAAFCENWMEASATVPCGPGLFPPLSAVGSAQAHLAYVRPSGGISTVKVLHHLALRMATERLWIQTPYFLPDDRARDALIEAARRGVDVRILTSSLETTDNRFVAHASHHRLAPLLERGVRVYHYRRTLLHSKVWTIDGSYALIGSTNFDERSFDLDDQVTLGVRDPELVDRIDALFVRDLAHATYVDAAEWRRRPVRRKVNDALAFVMREQL
jgi:cardiolipin synthase